MIVPKKQNANRFRFEKLKQLRLDNGISQAAIWKELGYTAARGAGFSLIERGRVAVTPELEAKLCKFFEVPDNYFRS